MSKSQAREKEKLVNFESLIRDYWMTSELISEKLRGLEQKSRRRKILLFQLEVENITFNDFANIDGNLILENERIDIFPASNTEEEHAICTKY